MLRVTPDSLRLPPTAARGRVVAGMLVAGMLAGCGDSGPDRPARTAGETPAGTGSTGDRALSRATFDDATRAIETYIGANRTREAEIVARRLASETRDDPALARAAHEYAARAYFARAELDESLTADARAALLSEAADEAALAADAADAAATGSTPPSPETRRFAAMLADRVGRRDEAQRLYDAALAASPDDTATLLPAALSALARDARDPRIDAFVERHERLAPDAAWSAGLRAEVALARGEAATALAAAERALALDRDLLEMRLILAKALRANARPRDAARLLSALSASERAKAAIAQQFALALVEAGEMAQAAAAWDAAIRAQPADPYIRAEAALAFLRAGDEARAASELEALDALFGGAAQRARIEPVLREIRGGTAAKPG